MHHPNKIPGAIKELFTQHSQIHSYNTRSKFHLHATHISAQKTEIFWQIQKHPFRIFSLKNICELTIPFQFYRLKTM